MKNEIQLINDISMNVHKIVVLMRKERIIPKDQLLILLSDLEDYRIISREQEVISKKIAYELFYLYNCVISQLSFQENKETSLVTELYMKISSVFNKGLYQ
ncbi:hypothetical protein [Paenibacillus piscarius]|uniref:hypothetical protein n=1 Tax=Paenibacillus piscarius TaxID=1089681 RepID=UPI001EE86AC5|nr:hypothetical protein [Paenibacillus piscarius]